MKGRWLTALLTLGFGLLPARVGAELAPPAAPAPPVAAGRASSAPAVTGCAFALACLTRYEAWPVTAVAIATTTWIDWRGGRGIADACRRTWVISVFPALAIPGFAGFRPGVIR